MIVALTTSSMFYHLQYIHLFRPFLKYAPEASPLPVHVSPRRICTANAGAISKLMRLYKKMYNLRQICNIAVYMVHSACTIHMLNLPEKTAKRDVIHGVRHLEEIAEDWLSARRTLCIISVLARKWNVEMPEEALLLLQRTDEKYGTFSTSDVPSPNKTTPLAMSPPPASSTSPRIIPEQRQFSPLNQFNQQLTPPHISRDSPTSAGLTGDILGGMNISGVGVPQNMDTMRQQMAQLPVSTGPSISMTDALSGVSAWAMPVTQPPLPNYNPQTYTPVHSNIPSATNSRQGTRHVSPSSIYAIDGHDWYLKDGVNWQQNFETWGLAGGQGGGNTDASPDTGVDGGRGDATAASMFMFRGLGRANEMDPMGFDSLGSMGNLDHLPGLD